MEAMSSSQMGIHLILLLEGDMDETAIEVHHRTYLLESGHGRMGAVDQSEYAVDVESRC